ncbi:MAG: hypothetical protein ACKVKG_12925 [Alphaproteobacteria bacterium]|jgi:hypothetical protein
MCRWLAYSGPGIHPEDFLFEAENSLIDQSMAAQLGTTPTNGDGFGLGWYGDRNEPGLFRDVHPAWNDDNLKSVAEQVSSRLFSPMSARPPPAESHAITVTRSAMENGCSCITARSAAMTKFATASIA